MPKPRTTVRLVLDAAAIRRAIARMARQIAQLNQPGTEVVLVAIQTGGVGLAQHLAQRLRKLWTHPVPVGDLDISMHRDDLDQHLAPPVHATAIPFDVTGKTVVLVDDVLFSGRTIRAAMDALNDFGRPKRTQLAVLIDRGHRELPIKADFVGKTIKTAIGDRIEVQLTAANGGGKVVWQKAGARL